MKKIEVMLIDANSGRSAILEQALSDAGYRITIRTTDTDRLLQQVQKAKPDVILIDIDLPDRDTLEQLREIGQDQPRPIIMFAERSDPETTAAALRAGVSAYVVSDLNPRRLQPIMDVAIARFREYQALRRELDETRNRLAERKVVEKAKGLLMAQRKLSEEEAYQTLRKLAMDRNQRIGEVARTVISLLEMLS
ncbi:MAG TPA: ANTAR domain-containing protein [Candidatus Competibacteraceae bacterium]|nr:MAG: ANTAR domain-containing protein [Candidatus Competibacteraceae bacterium]HOB61298.1 ANTAR domain-containing protein [Candidatus Competibacteraceae bacterium]HQA25522.1 ANTAR domain-containing protein [Candidatus Competibacteraceae bacterium]HQD55601.1 ANTAR domain-containing protein [Candidatus Competibacteraceae bacterium]